VEREQQFYRHCVNNLQMVGDNLEKFNTNYQTVKNLVEGLHKPTITGILIEEWQIKLNEFENNLVSLIIFIFIIYIIKENLFIIITILFS
jgi:hypothetical protein